MGQKIAAKIKEIRALAGWKNRFEAAERIGCSEKALGNYERGERDPGIEVLARISKVSGVPLAELIRLRLEDAGMDPDALTVREEYARYGDGLRQALRAGRTSCESFDAAAQVRAELREASIPVEWALLLMQLVTSGDLLPAGARAIIEFMEIKQPLFCKFFYLFAGLIARSSDTPARSPIRQRFPSPPPRPGAGNFPRSGTVWRPRCVV